MSEILQGAKIVMHFSLALDNGDQVDSNFDAEPVIFELGDGNLPKGFESFLIGLKAGQEETFIVPPEKAFGQTNPQNMQMMKVSDFAVDMPLSPGLVVSFSDAQNTELPGVIKSIEGKDVEVDFNHPLAGKNLTFKVKILSVEASLTADLATEVK